MKKLVVIAFALASLVSAKAATVTIAPGFSNQITVTLDGLALPGTFHVALGAWNGSVFTQFGAAGLNDTGTVNGAITGVGPAGVNSQVIHVYIGVGSAVNTADGNFVILKSGANTLFPSDVSSGTASATFQMNNAAPNVVNFVAGSAGNSLQGNVVRLVAVPEPSAALLGLLGIAGLIRRRR